MYNAAFLRPLIRWRMKLAEASLLLADYLGWFEEFRLEPEKVIPLHIVVVSVRCAGTHAGTSAVGHGQESKK